MKKYLLLIPICFLMACQKETVVQNNNYYQTSYGNEECYSGNKTFSQIILCMQSNSNKEIAQNRLTNGLIEK